MLKNLYVYFWRWATWKVFDAIPDDRAGVVCFITTRGYVSGPGFKGMREYLRRTCSEGWLIDVSPEGMRPDVPTRRPADRSTPTQASTQRQRSHPISSER